MNRRVKQLFLKRSLDFIRGVVKTVKGLVSNDVTRWIFRRIHYVSTSLFYIVYGIAVIYLMFQYIVLVDIMSSITFGILPLIAILTYISYVSFIEKLKDLSMYYLAIEHDLKAIYLCDQVLLFSILLYIIYDSSIYLSVITIISVYGLLYVVVRWLISKSRISSIRRKIEELRNPEKGSPKYISLIDYAEKLYKSSIFLYSRMVYYTFVSNSFCYMLSILQYITVIILLIFNFTSIDISTMIILLLVYAKYIYHINSDYRKIINNPYVKKLKKIKFSYLQMITGSIYSSTMNGFLKVPEVYFMKEHDLGNDMARILKDISSYSKQDGNYDFDKKIILILDDKEQKIYRYLREYIGLIGNDTRIFLVVVDPREGRTSIHPVMDFEEYDGVEIIKAKLPPNNTYILLGIGRIFELYVKPDTVRYSTFVIINSNIIRNLDDLYFYTLLGKIMYMYRNIELKIKMLVIYISKNTVSSIKKYLETHLVPY